MSEPATREDLERMTESILRATREDLKRAEDRILHLITALTERMDQRFDAVDKRFESLEQRLKSTENRIDRLGETTAGLLHQFTGFTRWAEQLDKNDAQILAVQAAQQRFIDDLAARLLKLERPLPPQ